jgi:hypothetical protein
MAYNGGYNNTACFGFYIDMTGLPLARQWDIVRKSDKYREYSLPGFVRWCALEDFIFGILPFGISSQDNRSVDGKREFPFFPFNFN